MCTVCGCGNTTVEGKQESEGLHRHDHSHQHHHHNHDGHDHGDLRQTEGLVDAGGGLAGLHVPGLSQERIVRIEQDILSKNNSYARENRTRFARTGTFALNFVSSPGSGKTTLLCRAIAELKDRLPIAVIEGDQQTSNDAERIRATGVKAVQVNTGRGCHLDAHMVGHAFDDLSVEPDGVLFIENVGNLICPSAFDLGEAHKVVVLSVTEGEDKPLKYPTIVNSADVAVITKTDLSGAVEFDCPAAVKNLQAVRPGIEILRVSAKTGSGMEAWLSFLAAQRAAAFQL